jgi:hypothetical protein
VENPELINSFKRRLLQNIQRTATSTPHLNSANNRVILSPIRRLLPSPTHGAAVPPRANPVLCRRINFSADELADGGWLDDSGIDNHDHSMDVSLTVVAPAPVPEIVANDPTIFAADAPTIAADASTIAADASTIVADASTIAADASTIAADAPNIATTGVQTVPEIATRGCQSARLVRPRITRRLNSCDYWVDVSSWQTNEAAGRAVEKTLSYMNLDKQKKLRHANLLQLLRREKKNSIKLKQKITELENERDCVPLKIRKQLSRMVVSAYNGGKAEIFLLDQIQNYGKLQGARWTEITIAHCIIFNARAPGAYEFLR